MINNTSPRTALPNNTWGPDTERILARIDEAPTMPEDDYASLLKALLNCDNDCTCRGTA